MVNGDTELTVVIVLIVERLGKDGSIRAINTQETGVRSALTIHYIFSKSVVINIFYNGGVNYD